MRSAPGAVLDGDIGARRMVRIGLLSLGFATWVLAAYGTVTRVLDYGRGGHVLGFDDVVYLLHGQRMAADVRAQESVAPVLEWLRSGPHSPLTEAVATLPPLVGLAQPEAVYVLNGVIAALLLLALASMLVSTWWLRFALAGVLVASPFGYLLANEYRPDLWFTAVAAIVLVGNVPYRMGSPEQRALSLESSAALVLTLAFVKPSWLALTAAVALVVVALVVIRLRCLPPQERARQRGPAIRAGALLVVAGVLWLTWLGRHFFDYVLDGALEAEYRLADSRAAAVMDSLNGARAYLGGISGGASTLAIAALIAAAAGLALTRRRRELVVALLSSSVILVAVAVGLAATWYSRHPSPFQGLFAYGIGMAALLAIVSSALHWLAAERSARTQAGILAVVGLALPALAVIVFMGARTSIAYPESTRLPGAPSVLAGEAIADDCSRLPSCAGRSDAVTVLATMAENVSPPAVEYYARSAGRLAEARGIPLGSTEVAPVLRSVTEFDYVLVRQEDYPNNGLPSNMLQDELLAAMRGEEGFTELPVAFPDPAYSLFRNDVRLPGSD